MFKNEKIVETKTCKFCNISFEITDKDLEFYEKVSPVFDGKKYLIPSPALCPDCRQQRRLSWRNERKIYKRKCDFSGKDIVSIYSPDKPYKVYHQDIWWSDSWNSLDYGKDFDFNKGFFEQFSDLMKDIPFLNLLGGNNQNSEFINLTADSKNCYMVIESSNNEDCYYGFWLQKCKNCCDVSFSHECEHCFEIQNCYNCFNLKYSNNCLLCTYSSFLDDCQGCENCFGCVNLTNKKYFILNKEFSKEDYNSTINEIYANFGKFQQEFQELQSKSIKKFLQLKDTENSSGDYLKNTKNCKFCLHCYDSEDCKYAEHTFRNAKDIMDVSTVGRDAQLIYEAINTGIGVGNDCFCAVCWNSTHLNYCFQCFSSQNCFGCIGLTNKSYCILNKQYTKEEYEKLVPKIIEKMQETLEWGEFFPSSISPFGYNETVANEYFPIESPQSQPFSQGEKGVEKELISSFPLKGGGLRGSFNWSFYEPPFPKVEKIIHASNLPDDISKIPDDILNWAVECEKTGKPFRIIKQELEFYRKHNLPIPRRHPDQRHLDRMALRNPRKLFDRKCDKCGKDIKTTYSPDRKEIVYCESCYEKEVY